MAHPVTNCQQRKEYQLLFLLVNYPGNGDHHHQPYGMQWLRSCPLIFTYYAPSINIVKRKFIALFAIVIIVVVTRPSSSCTPG